MPVITYSAVNRGRLVGGHSAGNQYQIECDFQEFPETMEAKGIRDETLDGTPEGWLDALQYSYQIRTDLVLPADVGDWREFLSSVANSETFQIDFTGTISSPGVDVDVFLDSRAVYEQQLGAAGYRYSFKVKALP
jgi:hypothetical protein